MNSAAATFSFVATLAVALSNLFDGGWKAIPIAVSGLLALFSAWVSIARTAIAEANAAESIADLRMTMAEALLPMVVQLNSLMASGSAAERLRHADQMITMAIANAVEVLGPSKGTRATWFALERTRKDVQVLRPLHSHGRLPAARTVLRGNTPAGLRALRMISQATVEHVPDVAADSSFPADMRNHGYCTYIAAAVTAGQNGYGMLTLDADTPNAFDKSDVYTLQVIARLLGGALHEARARLSDQAPDSQQPAATLTPGGAS